MATEQREIVLNSEELLLAADSYARKHPANYPAGRVVAVDATSTDHGPRIDAQLNAHEAGEAPTAIHFDTPAVIKMLIQFCIESNIPIPRAGKKDVRVGEGVVTLTIALREDEPRD
jgi:hypothetical protein